MDQSSQVLSQAVSAQAIVYIARGWRLLVCHPRGKQPLTPHGVKDASSDLEVIAAWLRRWPDANLAIATGAPGPQVLDIDDPSAVSPDVAEAIRSAPRVATPRGGHAYFSGTKSSTISLGYGELRGRGSYVVCPPSIHPSGEPYVWLSEPRGPLPAIPHCLQATRTNGVGRGEHQASEFVPHGQRHPYLLDFAVRLVSGSLIDPTLIAWHVRSEFERVCEPLPEPRPGYFEEIAAWATRSRIAQRERRSNGG